MEMEVTLVGLQNAGKTSLLRVLAVRPPSAVDSAVANIKLRLQGGEFTLE